MLIDELKLKIKAGNGGDGVVRWLHLKGAEFSGPAGGRGGRGGDVYILGVRDIQKLGDYKHKKEFVAESGQAGQNRSKEGKDGKDLIIELPVGSIIKNITTGDVYELLEDGEKILILEGGRGGWGNEHFKSSTHQRPEEAVPGQQTKECDFSVELRLFADAGLIGFPNAGKTTLLNALTNARAKVGEYQFTTLDPNLGDLYGFVLADIPGLLEGASEGKGLGHKFLRHIRRTKMLLHCIALDREDVVEAYQTIRSELGQYDPSLLQKKEIIILTKADLVLPEEIEKKLKIIKKLNPHVVAVSAHDKEKMKELADLLVKELREIKQ